MSDDAHTNFWLRNWMDSHSNMDLHLSVVVANGLDFRILKVPSLQRWKNAFDNVAAFNECSPPCRDVSV